MNDNKEQTNPFSLEGLMKSLEDAKKDQLNQRAQIDRNIENLDKTIADLKKTLDSKPDQSGNVDEA